MAFVNYVKFVRTTPALYNGLAQKDNDTLYFVTEASKNTGKLYLGEKIISDGSAGGNIDLTQTSINDFKDVVIGAGVKDGDVLVYEDGLWINKPMSEAIVSLMTGATAEVRGQAGLVPAPQAGDQNKFLRGDGRWSTVISQLPTEDKEKLDNLSTTVGTLIGTGEGSVKQIATATIAELLIPENAKESLDTLQEIANWIQSHPDDASAMQNGITSLNSKVSKLEEVLYDQKDPSNDQIIIKKGVVSNLNDLTAQVTKNTTSITEISELLEKSIIWQDMTE